MKYSGFGDSDNDLEMLSGGLSIAMGNGTTSVKAIAKHTTTSNGKDGIKRPCNTLVSSQRKNSFFLRMNLQ